MAARDKVMGKRSDSGTISILFLLLTSFFLLLQQLLLLPVSDYPDDHHGHCRFGHVPKGLTRKPTALVDKDYISWTLFVMFIINKTKQQFNSTRNDCI